MAIGPTYRSMLGNSLVTPALLVFTGIMVLTLLYGAKAKADDSHQGLTILTAAEDTVRPGDVQTVYIAVLGPDNKPLANTAASAIVFFGKDVEKTFSGVTGNDGQLSFSWKIGKHNRTGLEGVDIMAEGPDYDIGYASLVFLVFRS